MNPLHPDGDNRSRRDMGFRPAGLFSLTGHVDNLRQSDPSAPARYLQPPSENNQAYGGIFSSENKGLEFLKTTKSTKTRVNSVA